MKSINVDSRFLSVAVAMIVAMTCSRRLQAANIGYVTAAGTISKSFDTGWESRLISQGHTVVGLGDGEALPSGVSVSDFDLFIVSSHVNSGNFIGGPIGLNTQQAQIIYEWGVYDELFRSFSGNTVKSGQTSVDIVDASHPLAAGLSAGSVEVYTSEQDLTTGDLSGGTLSPGVNVIANDSDGAPTIMELPHGAQTSAGETNIGLKIALFPEDDSDFNLYTTDALALLDAAVDYGLANKIPEPSSLLIFCTGVSSVATLRRRRSLA